MVVLGFLLVADPQLAEGVVPTVRPLDDPPAGGVPARRRGRWWEWRARFPLVGRVDDVATHLGGLAGFGVVKAHVPAQVLRVLGRGPWPRHDDAVERGRGELHVGPVGRADDGTKRRAAPVAQEM